MIEVNGKRLHDLDLDNFAGMIERDVIPTISKAKLEEMSDVMRTALRRTVNVCRAAKRMDLIGAKVFFTTKELKYFENVHKQQKDMPF